MNPTQAKFHDDLESIATQMDLDVQSGKYTWADVQDRLKRRTTRLAASTDQYVHEYAWTSLAVAAGLGLLIGLMLPRE